MADLYKVVLKGKPVLGWARADVVANLARLMKIDEDKANDLLSGDLLTVKQNVEFYQAEKLFKVFQGAGVDCEMVKQAAPEAATKKRQVPKDAIECPKCGHVQAKGRDECGGCGVLFTKLEALAEADRKAKAAAEAPKPHFLEDLAHFIGPRKAYYLNRVEVFRQKQGAFAWTWNWSAFLAGFWWFFYRKMPLAALIVLIGLCIPVIQVIVLVAMGGVANYVYFQEAKRRIAKVRAAHPTGDISEPLAAVGGVDRRVPVLAAGLTAVVVALSVTLPVYLQRQAVQAVKNISPTAVLRPSFQTSEGFKEGGTACIIEVPEYERYLLLTVHHLFGPMGGFETAYAWNDMRALVQQVNATSPADLSLVVSTREVLQIPGAAVFDGQNVSRDLAVFPLPEKPKVPAFQLAPLPPAVDDQVWLMAFSAGGAGAGGMFHRARVRQVGASAVVLQFNRPELDLTGASGAPVIDDARMLVGLLVATAQQGGRVYGFVIPAGEIHRLIEEGFKL